MRHYTWAGKMIINQKPNILYKEQKFRKKNNLANKNEFHSNYNYKETPLKRDHDDISFRGVSFKGINDLKKAFVLYNNKEYRLKDNLEFLKKYIGNAPVILEKNTSSWAEIKKYISKSADGAEVKIKEKNWTKQLLDAVISPITDIPFRIVSSFKKSFLNNKKHAADAVQKKTGNILKNQMETLDNPDIVNSMIGYMDSAGKYKYDTDKIRSAGLMSNALKMFDSKSGNYNAVHERALTRIVTGFIPAFFLANDAYNLSRICDDDPQKADKERKLRFNQETKRVLSNAYLQLITLGALSKWINKSKATFIGVTAFTVLITEAFSRLSNGKKIHMINKEEAIEMNKKEGTLPPDYNPDKNTETPKKGTNPAFKSSQIFQGFGIASDMPLAQMSEKNNDKKLKVYSDSKPLLSLDTVAKWFVGTIVLAFAIKSGKKIKLKNGAQIKDYLNVISEKYKKAFNSLTQKDYLISKNEYRIIINKLHEYDETVGKYFNNVVHRYQKTQKIESIAREFSQVLNNAGLTDLAKDFEHIANAKLNSSFKNISACNAGKDFLKNRKKLVITENLDELFKLMENNGLKEAADKIKGTILDQNGIVDTDNYNKAKKLVNELAKDYTFTFENRFKVDDAAENLKLFEKAIRELKAIDPEKAKEYSDIVKNSIHADIIKLGKKDIPGAKQFFDFITEPVKFLWGTITLPYKHFARYIANWIKPEVELPKYIKEQELVATTIARITKEPLIKLPKMFGEHKGIAKINYSKDDFAEYMNKQFNKGFNSTTMSSLSNSDLSALAKNTSTAATIWFLMTDNHNMVMQKSNGEDKTQAATKAKERLVQETSRTFFNVMIINLFNNTFRNLYNSSLFGAQTVNTASTLVGEYVNRTAIGMPVTKQSREEIMEKEYKHITDKGFFGKLYRFMTRLTGKKVLTQRVPQNTQQENANK